MFKILKCDIVVTGDATGEVMSVAVGIVWISFDMLTGSVTRCWFTSRYR